MEAVLGDCRLVCPQGCADRVVMGYIFDTHRFLPTALRALKKDGGIIHYHFLSTEKGLIEEDMKASRIIAEEGFHVEDLETQRIKSYAPKMYHWVSDITINK